MDSGKDKARFVEQLRGGMVAIGNGWNDCHMFIHADLSIAMVGPEGTAARVLQVANILVPDIYTALDLFRKLLTGRDRVETTPTPGLVEIQILSLISAYSKAVEGSGALKIPAGAETREQALADARDQRHVVPEPFQTPQGLPLDRFLIPLDKILSA